MSVWCGKFGRVRIQIRERVSVQGCRLLETRQSGANKTHEHRQATKDSSSRLRKVSNQSLTRFGLMTSKLEPVYLFKGCGWSS